MTLRFGRHAAAMHEVKTTGSVEYGDMSTMLAGMIKAGMGDGSDTSAMHESTG